MNEVVLRKLRVAEAAYLRGELTHDQYERAEAVAYEWGDYLDALHRAEAFRKQKDGK